LQRWRKSSELAEGVQYPLRIGFPRARRQLVHDAKAFRFFVKILMGQVAYGSRMDEGIHAHQTANPIKTAGFTDPFINDNEIRRIVRHLAKGRLAVMRPQDFGATFLMQGTGQFLKYVHLVDHQQYSRHFPSSMAARHRHNSDHSYAVGNSARLAPARMLG
jgi:hypothetical protein